MSEEQNNDDYRKTWKGLVLTNNFDPLLQSLEVERLGSALGNIAVTAHVASGGMKEMSSSHDDQTSIWSQMAAKARRDGRELSWKVIPPEIKIGSIPEIAVVFPSDVDPEEFAGFLAAFSSVYAMLTDDDELVISELRLPAQVEVFI